MDRSGTKRLAIITAVLVWSVVTPFMWRDLRRRGSDQVRGPKWIWWIASTNLSGSAAYWMFGRSEAR
jgi:hypothetical protein